MLHHVIFKKKKKLHNEVPFFSENTAVDDA